jgi:hypothetical protein
MNNATEEASNKGPPLLGTSGAPLLGTANDYDRKPRASPTPTPRGQVLLRCSNGGEIDDA